MHTDRIGLILQHDHPLPKVFVSDSFCNNIYLYLSVMIASIIAFDDDIFKWAVLCSSVQKSSEGGDRLAKELD